MTEKCSYCGETKLCRKESMEPLEVGNNTEWICNRLYTYNWICKECDKVQSIIRNEERLAQQKKQKQNQLNWRKERDKILKQHDKTN